MLREPGMSSVAYEDVGETSLWYLSALYWDYFTVRFNIRYEIAEKRNNRTQRYFQ